MSAIFPQWSKVQHVATGHIYEIVISADEGRLEATDIQAYGYRAEDSDADPRVWFRTQAEMEDGRFIRCGFPPRGVY